MGDERDERLATDDDYLDGCDLTDDDDLTSDDDVDAVVLFADVDPNDADAVAQRAAEYRELFDAS